MTTNRSTLPQTSPARQDASSLARVQLLWRMMLLPACLLLLAAGCHRAYYRNQADAEVSSLMNENVAKRLAFIRYLYDEAVRQSEKAEPMCAADVSLCE